VQQRGDSAERGEDDEHSYILRDDDFQYRNDLVKMMLSLCREDEAAHPPNYSLFPATIEHLISNPSAGRIVLLHKGDELAGYAILIPY